MTRKNYRTGTLLILISLALMVGVMACTDGPVGLFASIAQEKNINANRTAAFDGTSPDFVGMLGTDYYTIINGTIWTRAVAGESWVKLATMPAGVSNGTASSAATAGTNLFVTFGLIGDSTQKVWATTDGVTWSDTLTAFPTTVRVDSLLSANGQAFAVSRTDTTIDSIMTTLYSVYYWNGSSFVTAGAEVTDISGRPMSVAYDDGGTTNYWITAGTSVFTGAPGNLIVLAGTPVDTFAGVGNESPGNMVLSSSTGVVHKYDGSVWTESGVFKKSDKAHAFSTPTIVADGTKTYLLVGTVYANDAATASGYLEFDISAGFDPTTASASEGSDFADIVNFQTSVAANYIAKLTVADEGSGNTRVFALTIGNGLWSNFFEDGTWSGWARE
ncbi:MAG: hypothetical protein ABIJ86_11005 [Spirochaetota bacterium]